MGGEDEPASEPVEELPPSCKLVYKMLEWEGSLTSTKLAEKTALSPRTIRYATDRLEDNGHVTSEVNLSDARMVLYSLAGDDA